MHVLIERLVLVAFLLIGAFAAGANSEQVQWMQDDITAFRERFLAVDRSFTSQSRGAAEVRLLELEKRLGSITADAFAVELCRIATLSNNAHSRCMSKSAGVEFCRQWALIEGQQPRDCEMKASPVAVSDFEALAIAFRPFLSEFYVVAVGSENVDLWGSKLVAVNGRSIDGVRPLLRSFSAGTVGYRDLRAAGVLASPQRLHAVGIAGDARSVTFELLTRAGRTVQRTLKLGESTDSIVQRPDGVGPAPWAFMEPSSPFRFRDAPESDGVIIQLRQNVDSPSEQIGRFLESSESKRKALGRKNVILDMRFNGGGNLMATRDFMIRWPSTVKGSFFVLTSPQTFSAGIVSVAYLKQAGAERVVIVGEPVGDDLVYFSDGRPARFTQLGFDALHVPRSNGSSRRMQRLQRLPREHQSTGTPHCAAASRRRTRTANASRRAHCGS